jgi:preprotein translocase subunit YajC
MGNVIVAGVSAAGTTKSGGGSLFLPLVLLVLFGVFYFVIFRPQRIRQRRVVQTQRQVLPGMQVRTTAGMYGTIVAADDQDVTLEVAPGVQIRMMRRAIMEVIGDGSGPGFAEAPSAETARADGFAAGDESASERHETDSTDSAEDERSAP